MAVELDWRFGNEVPDKGPEEKPRPRRRRWRVWLGLGGALLLLVGVGLYARWRAQRDALAEIEAEVRAVAQLELRALAEGDTELYFSLQDDADPAWRRAQETRAELDALLPPPLPGLTTTAVISVESARVVGEAARVEFVRMAGLPGGGMAPFRVVRFYRLSDDGRWLHTRADRGYAGHTVVFIGERVAMTSFETDREWIEPGAFKLEGLAEQFCSLAPCQAQAPLALVFTDTLDAATTLSPYAAVTAADDQGIITVRVSDGERGGSRVWEIQAFTLTLPAAMEPEGPLPAPFLVGTPEDEAGRVAWDTAMRELLLDRLIAREAGGPPGSAPGGGLLRAKLGEWLQAELGLSAPVAPNPDFIGGALDAGEWISPGALWDLAPAHDDPRRPLAEAEIELLLAFVEAEYGPSQVAGLLHALRTARSVGTLIGEALDENWPVFQHRYAAYAHEVAGRPFEPPGEVAAFAGYDLVAACGESSNLWGLRLDGPEMTPLSSVEDFGAVRSLLWSPDGAWLLAGRDAVRGGGLYLLEADGTGVGRLTSVSEHATPAGWSPDGALVACSSFGRSQEGGLVDVETDESVALNGHFFAWSPDGSQLAYITFGARLPHIWLAEGDGSNRRRLTEGYQVAWSPDGTQLALLGTGPTLKLYDVAAEETETLLDSATLRDMLGFDLERVIVGGNSLAWSPTGEWIGLGISQFDGVQSVRGGVVLVGPDGRAPRVLFARQGSVAVTGWSPEGRWLTCGTYTRDRIRITVIGVDGTVLLDTGALLDTGTAVSWSPDGRYLAVIEEDLLRILEVESGAWHSFEPPARCGVVAWNPRSPLNAPASDSDSTLPQADWRPTVVQCDLPKCQH
jgi:Tol biopolymer transport system component